ncbi:hypothetical protein KOR34_20390 [Posidoniimonas corsicana]|uniref:Uncharacterized protein n=1 Tax=Posidoniimonas corsicana TaxID=1938618 RepID=A0A5C5VHD9_9BACT|nr:hypothetical protein [Posidoniimonas corsicana]TWT37092.1 hypothetical protein KOR34_20390 [Posidoniimonas corsicana]
MSANAADLLSAIDAAEERFAAWREDGLLDEQQLQLVREDYDAWRQRLDPTTDYSELLSIEGPATNRGPEVVAQLQVLSFLKREIRRQHGAKRISPGAAGLMVGDVERRITAARAGRPYEPPPPSTPQAPKEAPVKRGWAEMLLDPRSLYALMSCGGGLLVIGLVVWLWSVGVFENKLVVASLLGGANLAALAAGAAVVLRTPYQTAGRAVTLLACLVMPLNLWFYDAQGLITLKDGGHLWAPALAICALYAGIARLLKDPAFVYALVGGVTMTGLLFLADQRVDRLWEIISPSALLVVIGVACVHAERLFAPGDGPFSRQRFGLAFFQSGHVVMAVGLAVLLVGRLVGRLYDPVFAELGLFEAPDVAAVAKVKLMALGLALVGAYTYFYSLFNHQGGARYAYSGIVALLWCEVIALDLVAQPLTEQLLVVVLASTALAANAATGAALRLRRADADPDAEPNAGAAVDQIGAATGVMANLFSLAALLLGAAQFVRGVFQPGVLPAFEIDAWYVGAMLAVAGTSTATWVMQFKRGRHAGASFALETAAVAAVLAGAGGLMLAGVGTMATMLALLAAAPVAVHLAAGRATDAYARSAWRQAAQVAGATLLVLASAVVLGLLPAGAAAGSRLMIGLFFAETAGLFALASMARDDRRRGNAVAPAIAAVSAWAAAWQWLLVAGLVTYAPMLAGSVMGLVCLAGGRLLSAAPADGKPSSHSGLELIGYLLTGLGGVAGVLLTFNRLAAGETVWELAGLMVGQSAVAVLAGAMARTSAPRRALFTLAGCHALFGVLVVNSLSLLTFGQRVELLLAACGGLLLVAGHLGWRRETDSPSGAVTFNLFAGSVLAAGPLVFGLISNRFDAEHAHWAWVMIHEIGVLGVGLGLLGAGVLCRVRSTTLVGAASLAAYLVSLVMLIDVPDRLQSVAVYMMVGGASFFTAAVLLSVYRDRLLSMPERIRNGDGVFRVLTWR